MFKKLFTMLFSVIMVLGMGTMTFAADAPVVSKDEVIDQLNAIDFGLIQRSSNKSHSMEGK